jgi:hypothetical protein
MTNRFPPCGVKPLAVPKVVRAHPLPLEGNLRRLLSLASAFMMAAVVSSPTSAASSAATVKIIQGQVSINRGDGFKPATGTVEARVGDLVMANPGGKGRIVYSGGCVVDVYPGAVVAVQPGSCKVKPMLLGQSCDPKELNCGIPAAPGTPFWVDAVGAGLIVAATCVGWCPGKEHHISHVVEKENPSSP